MLFKRHSFLSLSVLLFCSCLTLSPANLTTGQQVEIGLAALRGATGMYNSYAFINNPSQFKRSEMGAKLSSIAHDSMNIYNTHGTQHYRLQQSLRLVHDVCSLGHILSTSNDVDLPGNGDAEAMHVALQALHYALPTIQSLAGLSAATKSSSSVIDDVRTSSKAQAILSLAHFIEEALKVQDNQPLLCTRLSLCAASLGVLVYELKHNTESKSKDEDLRDKPHKKTNKASGKSCNKKTDPKGNTEPNYFNSTTYYNNKWDLQILEFNDENPPYFKTQAEAKELVVKLVKNIKNKSNIKSDEFKFSEHPGLQLLFVELGKSIRSFHASNDLFNRDIDPLLSRNDEALLDALRTHLETLIDRCNFNIKSVNAVQSWICLLAEDTVLTSNFCNLRAQHCKDRDLQKTFISTLNFLNQIQNNLIHNLQLNYEQE